MQYTNLTTTSTEEICLKCQKCPLGSPNVKLNNEIRKDLIQLYQFNKNENVSLKKISPKSFLILKKGFVVHEDPKLKVFRPLHEGNVFPGETLVQDIDLSNGKIKIVDDTEICALNVEKLLGQMSLTPPLLSNFLKYILKENLELVFDFHKFKKLNLEGKLVSFLGLFSPFPIVNGKPFIEKKLKNPEVSQIIGVSRESISRIYKSLVMSNILSPAPKGYYIENMELFKKIGNGED